jgi:hypothetical protein
MQIYTSHKTNMNPQSGPELGPFGNGESTVFVEPVPLTCWRFVQSSGGQRFWHICILALQKVQNHPQYDLEYKRDDPNPNCPHPTFLPLSCPLSQRRRPNPSPPTRQRGALLCPCSNLSQRRPQPLRPPLPRRRQARSRRLPRS